MKICMGGGEDLGKAVRKQAKCETPESHLGNHFSFH